MTSEGNFRRILTEHQSTDDGSKDKNHFWNHGRIQFHPERLFTYFQMYSEILPFLNLLH